VAGDDVRRAIRVELAAPGSEELAGDERDHAAREVHDAGAGEIDVAIPQAGVAAKRREPAAAPRPVAEHRVDDGAEEDREDAERGELPALGEGPGGDRERG